MIFRRYGTFTGGIDLPDQKHDTLDRAIDVCPRPGLLRVPLAPCGGRAARMLISQGALVTPGERIAAAVDDSGVDIFAPLAGRIGKAATVLVGSRRNFTASPAIEILAVESPGPIRPLNQVFDWRAASPQALRERLGQGGLAVTRPRPWPMAAWLAAARGGRCRTLICNAVEPQPYVTADHRLLAEHGADVIRGLTILASALNAPETILAVDQRRTDDYRELVGPARACKISMIALLPKYPIGNDVLVTKVLGRREAPIGGSSLDVGVAITDAATCFAVYRWAACDSPMTSRVVTVAGERIAQPANLWTPFGAAVPLLTGGAEEPFVHGGAMSGLLMEREAVAWAATEAVLALGAPAPAPPTPCIRCGWCTDHCPARLDVAALNDYFELGQIEQANRAGALACVNCGICSYICPARLPLAQRVRQLNVGMAARRRQMPLLTPSLKEP